MREVALNGVKVADFAWGVAGPLIGKELADYGATVVRVESFMRVDPVRLSSPFKNGEAGVDRAAGFAYYNANKYSMTLNFTHPKGLQIARRLISWADVVTESFRPGVMKTWGLSYEDIVKFKPDIIMISSSNMGQTGRHSRQRGLGNHLNGLIGLINFIGYPDKEPENLSTAYTDYVLGPFLGGVAVMAALDYRRRTGQGQLLDLSQFEVGLQGFLPAILDFIVNGRNGSRAGNSCHWAAPHGIYRCQGEDRWCAIAVFNDAEWKALCQVMGNPDWTRDSKFITAIGRKENEKELDLLIGEWTLNYSPEELMSRLQTAGVSAGVVKSPKDILEDPQLRERDFFWLLNHPTIGPLHHLGQCGILSKTPAQARAPAPRMGEHTEYVCRQILGIPEDEYGELLIDNVFDGDPG